LEFDEDVFFRVIYRNPEGLDQNNDHLEDIMDIENELIFNDEYEFEGLV